MLVLWRLPNTPIWRNIKQESQGQFVPGVMVVRIGASMYFANFAFIRDYISKMVIEFSEAADTNGMDASKSGRVSAGQALPPRPFPGAPAPLADVEFHTRGGYSSRCGIATMFLKKTEGTSG